jgi:membrane fusion protein, multidrug efflux system
MRIWVVCCGVAILAGAPAWAGELASFTVGAPVTPVSLAATGTVVAVRQGTLAAQVSGRVIEVTVRNGDTVKAGQPLLRIEAGESADAVQASAAAASGAAARLVSARADHERAQRLRAQDYISVAAMQRADAALRSAEAESEAAAAQARAARTRAGWHTLTAPYAGHVTGVWVSAGDLALPGKPLIDLYDPAALRLIAQLPESLASRVQPGAAQLLIGTAAPLSVSAWRLIPAVDAATHSVEIRAELPAGTGLEPGQFATLLIPSREGAAQLRVPMRAVLRRSEVTAVYVLDSQGGAHLRQVRLGRAQGDSVSVLSGLQEGERVALDPVAAGRP